jgi:hypothetical protein
MEEKVFPVLQSWRIRRVVAVVLGLVVALAAVAAALQGLGWAWWLLAALMLGLVVYNLLGLARQPWVVKLGPKGIDVRLATGRVMHAGWSEIEAHSITPGGRIGALLVRSGKGKARAVRVLPISTRLIGTQATEDLLAALKERLPKLEYRVPSVGGVNAG